MQQRQLRLGDILDDYCPRERRVTNHAVVAMIGEEVRQTRCTTCEADHEYKHAKVPRQRKKDTPAALTSQILAGAPKRVTPGDPGDKNGSTANGSGEHHEEHVDEIMDDMPSDTDAEHVVAAEDDAASNDRHGHQENDAADEEREPGAEEDEGPVHRPLIRASLPRTEGQQPPTRPIPEFTIRQPGGRQNRFRPRHGGGGQQGRNGGSQGYQGQQFQGNRSNGGRGDARSGRPPQGMMPRGGRRHGPGGGGRNKPSK